MVFATLYNNKMGWSSIHSNFLFSHIQPHRIQLKYAVIEQRADKKESVLRNNNRYANGFPNHINQAE